MAQPQLSFDGIQPVRFGGRDCTPSLDAELRLRIRELKFDTGADEAHADEILAQAFPKDEEYVKDFLANQMTSYEKQQLQAYLFAGSSALRVLDQAVSKAIEGKTNG